MIVKTVLFVTFVVVVVSVNEPDKKITMDSLSILKSPYVHMKNESQVLEKINGIVSQGTQKLQFVTDFDKTLTKQHNKNMETLHSFKIFYKCKQIPEPNLKRINAVLAKYDAIELDPTIAIERQKQVANEMYNTANEQFQGFEFDQREIEEVVRKYTPPIRDRTDELMSKLSNLHVPVIIFSAGLAEVLEEQLRQKNVQYKDSIHIIANHLKFNGTTLNGLENSGKLINPFNKYEHIIEYISSGDLKNRKNVILMGDNIADAAMARGKENEGIVFKIGFSYNQTDDSMKLYKESFDIVLDDDQTMNVILNILKLF